ncbi:hypothetical protein C1645_262162 [Glomus cerebriforme]|uniref:Uncharacterized protein n=1 Tax=Glomus cerebriforme TaxID=658196 RepID=A0A397SYI2_9GLOM|nr:hypothetical protein C1645_262162 [Glomus cerebriforme]
MSAKEIYYNIRTIWEWSEEFNAIIEDKCREIGDRYGTEVEYIKDKQSFDIKGTDYNTLDQSRDDLIRLLNSKATAAKQSLVIPRRPKKNKSKAEKVNVAPGLPPPSPFVEEDIPLMTTRQTVDDTENLEDIFEFDPRVRMDDIPNIFGWNRREPFLTFDYWNDVCKDCKVSGDIHEDKRRIEFTKGKEKNVKEAKKKIKQLQDNFVWNF